MRELMLAEGASHRIEGESEHHVMRVFAIAGHVVRVPENPAETRALLAAAEVDPYRYYQWLRVRMPLLPATVFADVYLVQPNDAVDVTLVDGRVQVSLAEPYRYLSRFEQRRNEYDRDRIDRLLCESVARACAGRDDLVLLLSDGKDSVPLARALHLAGRRARCVTFCDPGSDTEAFTRHIAGKYGHEHHVVDAASLDLDTLLPVYRRLAYPTGDIASAGYAWLVAQGLAGADTVVLDGSGSDPYMGGSLPAWRDRAGYAVARLTGMHPWLSVRARRPQLAALAYGFAMGSEETDGQLEPRLRAELAQLFADVSRRADWIDSRRLLFIRHMHCEYDNKGRVFDLSGLLKVRYPWVTAPLRDYFFHARHRNLGRANKGYLRRYLDDTEAYGKYIQGKRNFLLSPSRKGHPMTGPRVRQAIIDATLAAR